MQHQELAGLAGRVGGAVADEPAGPDGRVGLGLAAPPAAQAGVRDALVDVNLAGHPRPAHCAAALVPWQAVPPLARPPVALLSAGQLPIGHGASVVFSALPHCACPAVLTRAGAAAAAPSCRRPVACGQPALAGHAAAGQLPAGPLRPTVDGFERKGRAGHPTGPKATAATRRLSVSQRLKLKLLLPAEGGGGGGGRASQAAGQLAVAVPPPEPLLAHALVRPGQDRGGGGRLARHGWGIGLLRQPKGSEAARRGGGGWRPSFSLTSEHRPPGGQGSDAHSSRSRSQRSPPQPSVQRQTYSPADTAASTADSAQCAACRHGADAHSSASVAHCGPAQPFAQSQV